MKCPYCMSFFNKKEDLSRHIDIFHIGYGLLDGDIRKF